ncbi:hypothetical protein ACCO45_006294 [Purpureocillium lilacinum]|uniref:Uncharacterized protein n=2 Tax=Purpureocillium lilacinum TaxID=33203 RepID=A0ACC4D6P8_PURLI
MNTARTSTSTGVCWPAVRHPDPSCVGLDAVDDGTSAAARGNGMRGQGCAVLFTNPFLRLAKSQTPFRSARLPPPLQPQMLRQLTMSVNPARPDQPLPLWMAVPGCAIPVTRPPRRRHTPKLQFPLAPGSCIRGQALPPALPGGSAIGVEASQRAEAVLVARAVVTWHQRATLTRATHLPAMLGHGDTTDGRAYTIEGSSTELGYFLCNIPADENVSAATAKIPRAHVVAAPGCQNSSLVVRLPQGRHGAHPQPAHRITDLTIACRARNNGTSPRARSPY